MFGGSSSGTGAFGQGSSIFGQNQQQQQQQQPTGAFGQPAQPSGAFGGTLQKERERVSSRVVHLWRESVGRGLGARADGSEKKKCGSEL